MTVLDQIFAYGIGSGRDLLTRGPTRPDPGQTASGTDPTRTKILVSMGSPTYFVLEFDISDKRRQSYFVLEFDISGQSNSQKFLNVCMYSNSTSVKPKEGG